MCKYPFVACRVTLVPSIRCRCPNPVMGCKIFDHGMAVRWSDLRKSRSFLGLWNGGNPGSGAKENGEGGRNPPPHRPQKTGDDSIGVTGDGHPVIKHQITARNQGSLFRP